MEEYHIRKYQRNTTMSDEHYYQKEAETMPEDQIKDLQSKRLVEQ